MKTIRGKFIAVFIIAATVIMLIVLLLFNVALRFYFEKNARDELKNTFSTMNILVEKQLMNSVVNGVGEDALITLSAALTASRLAGNTEFFIFDEKYKLQFPEETTGTMLSDSLMRAIKNYNFEEDGAIERSRTRSGLFFIAGMPFEKMASGNLFIVFISGMAVKTELLSVMNLLLIAIMLVSLAVGVLYAAGSAKSLTRPIQRVCDYAREIGNGSFLTVPPDGTYLETNALIESINEMSGRLKASDQTQKFFLQNASHELRTPLMSIQGYSEAIEKGIVADPKEAAKIIIAESIRLTALVEEIMTLSKIDNNIYNREFQQTDLGEAIAECVDRVNGLALKENKIITPELVPGVIVYADDSLLSNVLGNILSNCLRYAKKAVTIKLERSGAFAVVRVGDDGDGFHEDDLPHIFERFYKGKGGKFGLGLAIAQKALELMGGTIEAKNGAQGAEFVIYLPAIK